MRSQLWEELNNQVIVAYQQGWHSDAASLGEDTLLFAEEIFGPDHLNTAESLKNLAFIYFSQAKAAEAAISEHTLATRDEDASLSDSLRKSQFPTRLALLNLSRGKYSRAESLLNRVLEIRKEALGPDHSDVLETMGNLAAVYNAQGRSAEAKSLLRSVRSQDAMASVSIGIAEADESTEGFIDGYENRKHMRHTCHFPVFITKEGIDTAIRGVSENIAQIGAFIKTKDLSSFTINDKVALCIFIPSLFSAKHKTVGMQGTGIITRIDEEKQGIAVRFRTNFKEFGRIGQIQIPEEARYKNIAHYISTLEYMGLVRFLEKHPSSFLVEEVEMGLDEDVILKFGTEEVDDPDVLKQLGDGATLTNALQARVIEISKRKIDINYGVITIGRAATNEIVLYNKLISKSHAFLFFQSADQNPYLIDLGSTNGTYFNDEKIAIYERYQLKDGDVISFGPQTKVRYLSIKAFCNLLDSIE
jgi:tetratricopeptide (TPR) repeat protein